MAFRSERIHSNLAGVHQFLEDIGIYAVDEETADIFGQLRAALFLKFGPREKRKRRHFKLDQLGVSENDIWIAAIALQHNLTIVSADSDFARLQQARPFDVENWLLPAS
jgi:tRNA(fMet)-specific endonuclease VapC